MSLRTYCQCTVQKSTPGVAADAPQQETMQFKNNKYVFQEAALSIDKSCTTDVTELLPSHVLQKATGTTDVLYMELTQYLQGFEYPADPKRNCSCDMAVCAGAHPSSQDYGLAHTLPEHVTLMRFFVTEM